MATRDNPAVSTALELAFWLSAGLLVYAQFGYPLLLAALARRPAADPTPLTDEELPRVALIVAAYKEASVIERKVANARALDYPADKFELIVACDGSPDETPALARAAGADQVLELPHGGKMAAQNAAVAATDAPLLAFSDANTEWEPGALRALAAATARPGVDYACGRVSFVNEAGTNQEGLYWRYEMWIRARESKQRSVTAGNGAIYAVRREAYLAIDPQTGHDLTLPFNVVKQGGRAVDAPAAKASELMVPRFSLT